VLQGTFSQPDRAHEKAGTGTEGTGKQGEPMGDANRQGMGEGGVATMTLEKIVDPHCPLCHGSGRLPEDKPAFGITSCGAVVPTLYCPNCWRSKA